MHVDFLGMHRFTTQGLFQFFQVRKQDGRVVAVHAKHHTETVGNSLTARNFVAVDDPSFVNVILAGDNECLQLIMDITNKPGLTQPVSGISP